MPRRTGLPTLTDERRKWDARRLHSRYSRYEPQSSVKSWRATFPRSTANANSARIMAGQLLAWYRQYQQDHPEAATEFRTLNLPRWRPPRGITERERQTIRQATSIIITYCVFRFPLEECWRIATMESTANPNSARILAQRTANNYIRKYPGAAQRILDNFVTQGAKPKKRTRSGE